MVPVSTFSTGGRLAQHLPNAEEFRCHYCNSAAHVVVELFPSWEQCVRYTPSERVRQGQLWIQKK